jgi:hypothetical protein
MNPPDLWKGHLEKVTGADGAARFELQQPLPKRVYIAPGMTGWEYCPPNDQAGFGLTEILEHGVSKEGHCPPDLPNISQRFQLQPGDVYVFASHLNLWERIRHCGHWECR